MRHPPPRSPLFPYTTLFRSNGAGGVADHADPAQADLLRRPRAHGGSVLPGVRREDRLGNPRRADARGYGAVVRERAVLDAEGKAGGWRFVKVGVLALIGVPTVAGAQTTFATGRAPML